MPTDGRIGDACEILVFEIEGRRFGLPAASIRELLRAVAVTPLPDAAEPVEGIIDVRGELVPVVDLAKRFGIPARPIRPSDHLIVVWANGRLVAVRADRAMDLVKLDAGQIDTDATHALGHGSLAGIAKLPDGLVVLQDPDRLLSNDAAQALAEALVRPSLAGSDR